MTEARATNPHRRNILLCLRRLIWVQKCREREGEKRSEKKTSEQKQTGYNILVHPVEIRRHHPRATAPHPRRHQCSRNNQGPRRQRRHGTISLPFLTNGRRGRFGTQPEGSRGDHGRRSTRATSVRIAPAAHAKEQQQQTTTAEQRRAFATTIHPNKNLAHSTNKRKLFEKCTTIQKKKPETPAVS